MPNWRFWNASPTWLTLTRWHVPLLPRPWNLQLLPRQHLLLFLSMRTRWKISRHTTYLAFSAYIFLQSFDSVFSTHLRKSKSKKKKKEDLSGLAALAGLDLWVCIQSLVYVSISKTQQSTHAYVCLQEPLIKRRRRRRRKSQQNNVPSMCWKRKRFSNIAQVLFLIKLTNIHLTLIRE